jgi:hypothetical protein
MGLFFDKATGPAEPDKADVLADAYREQPPATEDEFDTLRLQYLPRADEEFSSHLATALRTPALTHEQAHEQARSLRLQGATNQPFHAWRFAIAFALFALLVGGGIATDAAHMSSSSGALFGFAGSVFGVVVAFLGTEKDS